MVGFVIFATAASLFVQPWGQFPINDDWAYSNTVIHTLIEGRYTVRQAQFAWAIPQVLVGLPVAHFFNPPFLALRFLVWVCALISAWLCVRWSLGSRFSPTWLVLGSLATFLFPPFFQSSFTFMTDIPALLLWLLAAGGLAVWQKRKSLLFASLALAAVALAAAERQLAVFLPVGSALGQLWATKPRSIQSWIGVLLPWMVFLLPVVLIHFWWSTVSPVSLPPLGFSPNPASLVRAWRYVVQLGLMVLPFLVFKPVPVSGRLCFWLKLTFLVAGILHVASWYWKGQRLWIPFAGSLLCDAGFLPLVAGLTDDHAVLPIGLRIILTVAGVVGSLRILRGLALMLNQQRTCYESVILWASFLYLGFLCVRVDWFDRYAIALIPLAWMCIFRGTHSEFSRTRVVAAAAVVFATALFSCTLAFDYFRWNEARWYLARRAEALGGQPSRIQGGHEYMAMHGRIQPWWLTHESDYVVSFSKLDGFSVVETKSAISLWAGERRLWLLAPLKKQD